MDDLIAPSPDQSPEQETPSWLEAEAEKHPEMSAPIEHLNEVRTRLYRMDGRIVRLRSVAGHEYVAIDGKPEPYRVLHAGFVLDRAWYAPPEPSLLEATAAALGTTVRESTEIFDQLAPLDSGDGEVQLLPCGRSNFVSLSDAARDRLAEALNILYADGTVGEFAREHRSYSNQIHTGPAFLPWHRHFILRFEAELRRVDAQVRLPYWDWALTYIPREGDKPAESIELTNDLEAEPWKSFFGGRANEGGRFDHWNIVRASSAGGSIPNTDIIAGELTSPDFLGFRQIEGFHHGGVHNWVGGTMASADSPGDPLFFLHHANVDRLWAIWQRNHAEAAQYTLDNLATESGSEGTFVPIDEPMAGGATPRSMLDHTSLGVVYFERDSRLEEKLPGGYWTIDATRRLGPVHDISFGRVIVDDLRVRTLALRNTGSLPMNVEVPAHVDGQISWFGFKGLIRPCRSVRLNVTFSPTGTGSTTEDLTIKTDARGGTRTITVSGSGRAGTLQ